MTPEQLAEAKARAERSRVEIGAIAKEGAARRWRMSIPAQPDRDSDLILAATVKDVDVLVAEVERLREALARTDAMREENLAIATTAIHRAEQAEAARDRLKAAVELVGFTDLAAAMKAGEEHDGHIVWIDNAHASGDLPVPQAALKALLEVAAYVSRGKSSMLGPYPDATARIALGALPDELLDLIREAPDA